MRKIFFEAAGKVNLELTQVAKKADIYHNFLAQWVFGKKQLTDIQLRALEKIINVDFDVLKEHNNGCDQCWPMPENV